jgi:hypothetical protein
MRGLRRAALIAGALLVPAACAHADRAASPGQSPAHPTPRPRSASASPVPQNSVGPATTTPKTVVPAAPAPPPSPSSAPIAVGPPPPKTVPRVPPNAPPEILNVAVSETTVHPGDRVVGSVITTSNVASVEARIGGYSVNLAKTGVGRFELAYTVGPLPWFIRGNFTMQVTARNTRGDAVTRAIPLTVR